MTTHTSNIDITPSFTTHRLSGIILPSVFFVFCLFENLCICVFLYICIFITSYVCSVCSTHTLLCSTPAVLFVCVFAYLCICICICICAFVFVFLHLLCMLHPHPVMLLPAVLFAPSLLFTFILSDVTPFHAVSLAKRLSHYSHHKLQNIMPSFSNT